MAINKRSGARVMLGIPTLTSNPRTPQWIDAMAGLQMPLGSSMARVWESDLDVADARNRLCLTALQNNVQYLVMLGDDVLPPPNMILQMLDMIGREYPVAGGGSAPVHLLTGVYWTKTDPPEPYLWDGLLRGSKKDWVAGDFFEVDFAGCDALMIDVEALRYVPFPWFNRDWVWEEGQTSVSPIATEDFYFYAKMRKYANARLFCDSAIQCLHEDRTNKRMFGLLEGMPQAGVASEGYPGGTMIAELGPGLDVPFFGEGTRVVKFDARPEVKPDVRCDLAHIPPEHTGKYDVVHARHVLEHFGRAEAPGVLAQWVSLLKPGGEVIIRVPNLEPALRAILDDKPDSYSWAQIYGGQENPLDTHRNGFTVRKLTGLFRVTPGLTDIRVETENEGLNIVARARYTGQAPLVALLTLLESATDPVTPTGSDSSVPAGGTPAQVPPAPSDPTNPHPVTFSTHVAEVPDPE